MNIDIHFLVFLISTVVSCVSFLFVLFHCKLSDKLLLMLLFSLCFIQIFWKELPSWTYDAEFVLFVIYAVKTKFYIKKSVKHCNSCDLKKRCANGIS